MVDTSCVFNQRARATMLMSVCSLETPRAVVHFHQKDTQRIDVLP
jgi:hypothetical protein